MVVKTSSNSLLKDSPKMTSAKMKDSYPEGDDAPGPVKLARLAVLEAHVARGVALFNLTSCIPFHYLDRVTKEEALFHTLRYTAFYSHKVIGQVRRARADYPEQAASKSSLNAKDAVIL